MAKSQIDETSETFQLIGRIKAVRIFKKMTRQEFAESLRVTGSFYSQVERANNKPNAGMLLGIAKHFPEISTNWLLTGDGEMIKQKSAELDIDLLSNIARRFEHAMIIAMGGVEKRFQHVKRDPQHPTGYDHGALLSWLEAHAQSAVFTSKYIYDELPDIDDKEQLNSAIDTIARKYADFVVANPIKYDW